jgi:voltage-gated potassium channel
MTAMLKRFVTALGWLCAVTGVGTVGFRVIEGWSWLDSLFMTVITLSTVGYLEVHPLSPAGMFFTIALIVVGVGMALYVLSILAELVVEGRLSESYREEIMAAKIKKQSGHVIIAGFGRFGRAVVRELLEADRAVVVVDCDPNVEEELHRQSLPHVIASASTDDGLVRAGIEGASAIVVATPSEAENVYIALAARELNPNIRIHARGESEAGARRLRRAGAHHVTAPFQMGGARTAASILQPAVVDFLEIVAPLGGASVDLEELQIGRGSPLCGRSISESEDRAGAFRIVAIKRPESDIQIVPSPETEIREGDLIIVIGERNALRGLADQAVNAAG